MKSIFSLITFLGLLASPICSAQDNTAPAPAACAVGQAASQLQKVAGELNTGADYYIYLCSASWCGPCRAIMPRVVAEYQAMKAANVEIILLSCDRSVDAAKAYLDHYKANFYTVMYSPTVAAALPGNPKMQFIPHAMIVDKDGKVLKVGHGSIALQWRQITNK